MSHMDRTVLIIFVLYLGAACAHEAKQGTPKMFASLLSSRPAGWSDSYEQASHASFRGLKIKNCDLLGPVIPSSLYFEMDVGCADSGHYEMELPASLKHVVGSCSVSLEPLASPFLSIGVDSYIWNILNNITEVTLVGRYNMQCGFHRDADECGLECGDDGIILESQGPVYASPNVAIPVTGAAPLIEGLQECYVRDLEIFQLQIQRLLGYIDNTRQAPKTAQEPAIQMGGNQQELFHKSQPTNGAKAQQYRRDPSLTYTKGAAAIMTGPFRLIGKHSSLKFDEGFLQWVIATQTYAGNPAIIPTSTTFIADPNRGDLNLKKRDDYKY